jgi:osmotically-inducible protein OsmY
MSNGALLQAPESLREAVVAEIDDDPNLDAWAIGVAAEEGVVTLTGTVDTLAKKEAAARAAKRVDGVRSIANDLHVRAAHERTDTDIARDAMHRLRNSLSVPETVKAVVSDGYVTLDGTVAWLHQRAAAETAVKYVNGVKSVCNDIKIVQS